MGILFKTIFKMLLQNAFPKYFEKKNSILYFENRKLFSAIFGLVYSSWTVRSMIRMRLEIGIPEIVAAVSARIHV